MDGSLSRNTSIHMLLLRVHTYAIITHHICYYYTSIHMVLYVVHKLHNSGLPIYNCLLQSTVEYTSNKSKEHVRPYNIHTHTHARTCMNARTRLHAYTCSHMYTSTHTHMHMHMRTHARTHTHNTHTHLLA